MASENVNVGVRNAEPCLEPSTTFVRDNMGENESGTNSSTIGVESFELPPVSVART